MRRAISNINKNQQIASQLRKRNKKKKKEKRNFNLPRNFLYKCLHTSLISEAIKFQPTLRTLLYQRHITMRLYTLYGSVYNVYKSRYPRKSMITNKRNKKKDFIGKKIKICEFFWPFLSIDQVEKKYFLRLHSIPWILFVIWIGGGSQF